jgi:hypothetical protein
MIEEWVEFVRACIGLIMYSAYGVFMIAWLIEGRPRLRRK